MLEISNITKEYVLKDQSVMALNGVNLVFRRSEFVSILGPSGCGKTTLLNIIGGLDRYTSGDLIIDGVSTKDYKDKDWDNYRNHKIGFVFQSYNLIPHQTVLENVELALTLSGIKKKERRARAIEVLEKVGLGDKLKSKPNQLSGGQMQRVAIARALVNNPEIILADEPTGALDSKTSVQIMELLKEVSQDRLVIMVTHNPELAETYSTRIVKFLDGEMKEDSNPYTKKQAEKDFKKYDKNKKTITFQKTEKKKSMSFFTALSLSFKNLMVKKGRTSIVAFAGSIGIIGIALILAVSAGMTNYINKMQTESLASYPVSATAVYLDMESVTSSMGTMQNSSNKNQEIDVYEIKDALLQFGKYNYLSQEFTEHMSNYYNDNKDNGKYNDMVVSYASDMRLVTEFSTDFYMPINSNVQLSAMSGNTSSTFFEGLNNENYVRSMYDVYGTYPTESNQLALVLSENRVPAETLMSYGINVARDEQNKPLPVKYEDIINKVNYKLIYNDAYFNSTTFQPNLDFSKMNMGNQTELFDNQPALKSLYDTSDNGKMLTVTAVLVHKEDADGSLFSNGIMYTQALAKEYHENCQNSNIAKSVKDYYFDTTTKTLKNAEENLKVPYAVNIQELSQLLGMNNLYNYNTLKDMKDTLTGKKVGLKITDEQIIDLYMQMYGASNVATGMYFYVNDFDAKEEVMSVIKTWNSKNEIKINVGDTSAFLTNMLGGLVNIISYVLIAFASISLVVSSIMIAIITYTSVIERTKEIGVLRSIGASKRDVSRVFNAETTIIGLLAGVIGVVISAVLTLGISLILKALTGIAGLAVTEILSCIILIAISVLLTFIAGLIPASIAAKKDPVMALRSE